MTRLPLSEQLSSREAAILTAARGEKRSRTTEAYQYAARCSLGEATAALLRLERLGFVTRGPLSPFGMTWKATRDA